MDPECVHTHSSHTWVCEADVVHNVLHHLHPLAEVDVIKELTEGIKILNGAKDPQASQEDIEKIEYAFECISDWVDQIDMANNFHKIGGFESLKTCLKSNHASIR